MINFALIQTDLLSQNDSLVNQENLVIGGLYIFKLISGEELSGELQSYDSLSIRLLYKKNSINLKREHIKSIEIYKDDYTKESSFKNINSDYSYWSITAIGGGIIPAGNFDDNYGFSGSIGTDLTYHINQQWALYGNITYNFLSYNEPDYYYYYPQDNSQSCFEMTIGPRYYFSQEKTRIHSELGIGYYSLTEKYNNDANKNLGINFGLGTDI